METQLQEKDLQSQFMLPTEVINSLAAKMQMRYRPPKDGKPEDIIQPDEWPTVVQMAIHNGFMPLSSDFHFWKNGGVITVTEHYAFLMNWASKQGRFRLVYHQWDEKEKEENGVAMDNFVVSAYMITPDQEKFVQERFRTTLNTLLDHGVGDNRAIDLAQLASVKLGSSAHAVVNFTEVFYWKKDRGNVQYDNPPRLNPYLTPKGWIPGWTKAEKRAMVNLIRRTFGEPTPIERYELSMVAMKQSVIAATAPDDIVNADQVDQYIKVVEQNDDANEGVSILLPRGFDKKKRVDILRGPKEEGIDFDPIGSEPPKQPSEQDEFINTAQSAYGLSEEALTKITMSMFGLTARYLNRGQIEKILRYFSLIKQAKTLRSKSSIDEFYSKTPELLDLERSYTSSAIQSQIKHYFDPSDKVSAKGK